MIFMVTCRRRSQGSYGDEEQAGYRYDYLHEHLNGERGQDGFRVRGKRTFEAALRRALQDLRDNHGVNTPKVGLYLHGYNNDWQDSIDELVDLHRTLTPVVGYEPVLVGFSWPSSGTTAAYLSDREEARDAMPAFVRFLKDINDFLDRNRAQCFSTGFCIAHSMGNYLLRKGMEYLSDSLGAPVGRLMFNETVMLAPDLASKDIEQDGKGVYISQFSRRVHVYYSAHDRALKASSAKRFGAHRLGRDGSDDYGNLPGNVVLVNAELYANSAATQNLVDRWGGAVSVHSSHRYHPEILADVGHVLSSMGRSLIPTREEDPRATDAARANHYVLT